ncbi:MAG TPA: hypothetical protein VGM56_25000 [Byssovorax sp.]|jgi:hypothetical protein
MTASFARFTVAAACALASGCAAPPPTPTTPTTPAPSALAGASYAAAPVAVTSKAEECNGVIRVINRGVARLSKPAGGEGSGVEGLETMATDLDATAAAVSKIHVTTPALAPLAAEYAAMARGAAKAASALAAAARARDVGAIGRAEVEMDRAVKLEDPIVDRINALCHAP